MTTPAVGIARPLEAFFTQRLSRDRQASPYTIAAYRDSFGAPKRFRPDERLVAFLESL
jgi:hypothetical protein